MCLNLVAESEKMRKQGHQGVAMKPATCWLCRDVTTIKMFFFSKSAIIWSMMQNKNNKIGDFKKNRDIKKPEAAIYYLLFIRFCNKIS